MEFKRDIEFLYEIGMIRNIDRSWKQFFGTGVANLAEHHFRVAYIAMIIAKHEGANIDRVMRLAMIHDIAESRTGDANYITRQYTKRDESKGITDMVSGTVLEEDVKELWSEYEKRETLESKVVKDADWLDVDIELREINDRGNVPQRLWKEDRERQVLPKFYTESAKKMWHMIYETEPSSWHQESPHNRFNSGDWKTK